MQKLLGANIYAGFVPTFALDLQGWNSISPAFEEIVGETRPAVAVDVGVWKGGSTLFLAGLMRKHEIDGVVIGVDTFLGSPEHTMPGTDFFDLIPRQFGRAMLYEQFLSNVVRSRMQDRVVPLAQTSIGAAIILGLTGIRAGLVHLDAAHDYGAVLADARAFWAVLEPGGYLIGDDYHASWPGVVKAADEFSKEIGIPLRIAGPKWIMRKV
jgi:hypothetical protein